MLRTQVAEGIDRIEDAYTNWYLVEEGDSLTIVDAGVPASWESLGTAMSELGRSPKQVEAIVLTHAHFDHIGFAERGRRELGVPVLVHEDDTPLTRHPMQYAHERSRLPYLLRPKAMPILAALARSRAFFPRPIAEVRRFGDSAGQLDVPGRPHVVPTPGHTLGHVSLYFPDRGAVIAGDAVVTLNPYTGETGPQIVAGAATADSERNLAALDALAATDAETVLCGHGEPWARGAREAVRLAREAGPS